MNNNFDRIIDECIDRISRGQSIESCLADYPEYGEQLEPLLRTILQTKEAYSFVPSANAKKLARQRFNTALEKLEQRRREKESLLTWLFPRPRVWATVAAAIVILIAGYFGMRSLFYPTSPVPGNGGTAPVQVSPLPNPQGNFVFLISDEENAIRDFKKLEISISEIGIQPGDDSGMLLEFKPELNIVDLTVLTGDNAQQIWRGNIPVSEYNKVFIHISSINGILEETGKQANVKLPSEKLQITKPFQVTSSSVTSFVFDISVFKAGESEQYIILPQVKESGADKHFIEVPPRDK